MKKLLLLIPIIALFASCSDDITGLNEDTKRPTYTEASFLFTNAQHAMMDQITSTSVNVNIFRLFAQQWAEVQYPQESQYDLTGRKIPDMHWAVYYRDVLRDLKESKSYLLALKASFSGSPTEAKVLDNKIAVVDILTAYTYGILVDTFGDIPYTESLDIIKYPLPKYDDALTIYKDLALKLKTASASLDKNAGSFGAADLVYGGNTEKWAKFANTIRFRMAINMDDLDHAYATSEALASIASGIITNSTEDAYFAYAAVQPNANPLYVDLVASNRDDFVPADTFVNKLNALSDPRRATYFTEFPAESGNYKGGVYGTLNIYGNFSHITPTIKEPSYRGVILTYSEVEFLLAEAVERGIAVGGTAASHYNSAINASMKDWGVSTNAAILYMARPDVAYATATGTWKQKIGEQAWISLYNRGFEAWTSYRRLDFPTLKVPAVTYGDIKEVPKRYSYPGIEQTLNKTNYNAAVAKLGNDSPVTHVFWDKF